METVVLEFKGCKVIIIPDDHYLETIFPDGKTVPARPQDNDAYRKTALDLGYGEDTWRMCLHHELSHTMLAEAQGLPYSPTLRAVSEGKPGNLWEEGKVMEFQKQLVTASKIPGW